MNPLADQLNATIRQSSPPVFQMLSRLGKELYFPKGILSQTAEAAKKATRYNATIGIATEGGSAMHLRAVMKQCAAFSPDEVLTYAPACGLPQLRSRWRNAMYEKNPSLQGKIVLQLTIAPSGKVLVCKLISSELADASLGQNITRRVKLFDFGAKEVSEVTITYPIDFLPA